MDTWEMSNCTILETDRYNRRPYSFVQFVDINITDLSVQTVLLPSFSPDTNDAFANDTCTKKVNKETKQTKEDMLI